MVDEVNKANIKGLKNWERGNSITAEHLDQPVKVLQSMGGIKPPEQVNPSGSLFEMKMFKVLRLETDVIICNTWDGVQAGEDEIKVALPFLLRRTPFDNKGVIRRTFSYEYFSDFQRVSIDSENDDDEENQVITDSYEEDDIIFAVRGIFGGTSVYHDDPTNEIPVVWLDTNDDGRYWGSTSDDFEEA